MVMAAHARGCAPAFDLVLDPWHRRMKLKCSRMEGLTVEHVQAFEDCLSAQRRCGRANRNRPFCQRLSQGADVDLLL